MWMKFLVVAVAAFLLFGVVACQKSAPESASPETAASQKTAPQSVCGRTCLEGYVDKYMDAMLKHETSKTLFAEKVRFTENGVRLQFGNEGLWSSMVGKGTYKFYVPDVETQQVAFIGTAREESNTPGQGSPVVVA